MSDPVLAEADIAVVIAEALALYKETTGVALAPGDPKRLHLQGLLLLLAQQRSLIDFSGKQSLLRFTSDEWIEGLAELWGESKLPAKPSVCTERFHFNSNGGHTIPAGLRVTDGTSLWRVTEDTTDTGDHVDAPVECTVDGAASNGVATGQIDTLVDKDLLTGCTSVENITETISGREIEQLEDFRARLRDVPESRSTCGPRTAYQAAALEASASVADAVALGPEDGDEMAGATPDLGEVHVVIIKGDRDAAGVLTAVEPEPDSGLLATVLADLSAEDVRPLTDFVSTKAAEFVDFDAIATFYIGRSRALSAAQIQVDVQAAWDSWLLWQQSKIGRDINPDEMRTRLVNAGAKRIAVSSPSYSALLRDESARLSYVQLIYGGVEDD